MNITLVIGARPNFIKIAPIISAIKQVQLNGVGINYRLVHTGQHFDEKMSSSFFKELNIPEPDVNFGCGGGTQAEQTACIMIAFEKELNNNPSDLVIVVGDVTSTMACSIVAKKLRVRVAHVEAGIRSWDLSMPEEINRMVTDILTDYFFTTTELAGKNLLKIGISEDRIFFVGNVMIDTLLANRHRFKKPMIWDEIKLEKGKYIVLTLHRPANVDEETKFSSFIKAIIESSNYLPIIFPVHPRTRKILQKIPKSYIKRLTLLEPLCYLEFIFLVENAKVVITDSGGITEETTVLGIPCITLRKNTERPETVEIGTNEIIGVNPSALKPFMDILFAGNWKKGQIPKLWDGKTADRILKQIIKLYGKEENINYQREFLS